MPSLDRTHFRFHSNHTYLNLKSATCSPLTHFRYILLLFHFFYFFFFCCPTFIMRQPNAARSKALINMFPVGGAHASGGQQKERANRVV